MYIVYNNNNKLNHLLDLLSLVIPIFRVKSVNTTPLKKKTSKVVLLGPKLNGNSITKLLKIFL